MYSANISASFQHCLLVDMTSQNCKTSNQRWNNVAYVNVGIYNVEQRRINVLYFNVAMNNVRQRRNNVVIFNVEFHSVGKRRNNVVKMIFFKRTRIFHGIHRIQSFNYHFIIFFSLLPMLRGICRRVLAKPRKFLKDHKKYCIVRTWFKPLDFAKYELVFNFTRELVQAHND